MLKVTEFQCPTPGCGKMLQVKMTDRGRPSVSCKLSEGGCGWTGFSNAKRGVDLWTGEGEPASAKPTKPAAPPASEPVKPPNKNEWDWGEKKDVPAEPPKKNEWDW